MKKMWEKQNAELESDLKSLRENKDSLIAEKDMKEAENNEKKYTQEWNKRRKGCWEVLEMLAEGMEKSSKEVFVFFIFFINSKDMVGLDADPQEPVSSLKKQFMCMNLIFTNYFDVHIYAYFWQSVLKQKINFLIDLHRLFFSILNNALRVLLPQ